MADPRPFFPQTNPHPVASLCRRLAWIWGGNPFYLASAACVLAGLYHVLYPVYQQGDPHLEKFLAVATLNGYEMVVLGVTLLILAWRNVVDDAVALTVIIATLLVGSTMGLDVIAPGYTGPTLLLGSTAALLAVLKVYCLDRRIVGRFTPSQLTGLGVLSLCNFFMPTILGCVLDHVTGPGFNRREANPILAAWWLCGWLVALGGAGTLVAAAARVRTGWGAAGDPGKPFLQTSAMRWIVVAIVLVGTLLHQWGLFWSFGIPLEAGDLGGGVVVICLLGIELVRAYRCSRPVLESVLALLPLLVFAAIIATRDYTFAMVFSGGLICYPPLVLLLSGVALGILAARGRRKHLFIATGAYLVAGALTLGVSPTGESPMSFNLSTHGAWSTIALGFLLLAAGAAASLCKRPPNPAPGMGTGPGSQRTGNPPSSALPTIPPEPFGPPSGTAVPLGEP